ncbi:MAG TPA: SDR family NAD(P)-dependent oxidoreductase [Kofleriaceae bacterium]|nr:SDR family NAD(P)-dependent oxidoreductase [Kofleriaceae bacterium]
MRTSQRSSVAGVARTNGRRGAHGTTRPAPGHVVITGAAGAIGSALARAMRAAWPDVELALVDRANGGGSSHESSSGEWATSGAAARIAAEVGGTAYGADLADVDALPQLVARIEENGPIDALVNCAGVMRVRDVSTWRWEDAHELIAIDLLAPLRLQDLVVRRMLKRRDEHAGGGGDGGSRDGGRRGLIVNIASMAGRVPLKGCAYYGAAKAGLAMASEIARADLAGRGVQVVTVYPGPVKSALEAGARADYGGAGLVGRFAPTGDPSVLASKIMRAIDEGQPRVIYPGLYGVGWTAPNLSRWVALAFGPSPAS